MSSAASISFHDQKSFLRKPFLALAAALLLAALIALLFAPSARADSPVLTVSSGTTNPGGTVMVTGTGWAPAQHYNLYVFNQKLCNGATTCLPPANKAPINTDPIPIGSDGSLQEFDFMFVANAGTITYVFTVVADYPAGTPYSASVPVQVVPAGTPPSGTPISSSPSAASPTANPTNAATTTTPTHTSQGGGTNNNQTTNTTGGGGSTTVLIVVVLILLLLMIGVLVVLLRILPPKRRAIRAAYYGVESTGPQAAPGRTGAGQQRRQPSGAYYRSEEQMPWQGGVASWGEDEPRSPHSSRPQPRSPRSPGDNSGPRW
jgi:hypothetical protein